MKDLIERQAAIDALGEEPAAWPERDEYEQGLNSQWHHDISAIKAVPSAQKKGYTKADYIMALHKEYGCSLARAEEAHQKVLEYLQNTLMMKG